MRPIAALLERLGRDEEPGPGTRGEGPSATTGAADGGSAVRSSNDAAEAEGESSPTPSTSSTPSTLPTHVCAICRSSFRHHPTSCPDCGNTVVTPVDEWEDSERIRHLCGGG